MRHLERAGSRHVMLACVALLIVLVLDLAPAVAARSGYHVGLNVQVSEDKHFQMEAALAMNPEDERNLIIAANDGRISLESCKPPIIDTCIWVGTYASWNSGKSWRSALIPGYPGGPRGILSEFELGYDPVVGFDGEGRAYAGGIFAKINRDCPWPACPNLDTTLAIASSDDGGRTWNEPVIVDRGQGDILVNDHPQMAVDHGDRSDDGDGSEDGNVYLAWTKFDEAGGVNMLANSRDHGRTWSTVPVSDPHPSGDPSTFVLDPMVAVGPHGEVYVVQDEDWFTENFETTKETFWLSVSQDGGRAFGDPRVIAADVVPDPLMGFSFAVLAVDIGEGPHAGRLYATWIDGRSGDGDVYLKWSDDHGASWSPARRVNNDNGASAQYGQWISVAPNGRVDIAFYDRRDDPDNVLNARYYAGSTDSGLTFTNARVSTKSWDPTLWPFFPFVDDYDQVVSTADAVHLVWADARNAGPDDLNFDIYSATISAGRGTIKDTV